MQPYLFPYIGYFHLIYSSDIHVVYDDVDFIKNGWINRNNIYGKTESLLITIPLSKQSSNKKINETEINYNVYDWKKKIYKQFELTYQKAPYYSQVFKLIESIFEKNHKFINELNVDGIQSVVDYIGGYNGKIIKSSTEFNNTHLKSQERILDICKQTNSDTYINVISGNHLYNKDIFKNNGIDLCFINSKIETYQQFHKTFIPFLSILDILMFNDKNKIQEMLKQYTLI